ncbi:MAG TPA: AEC family transporter [Candidatus Avoscillospira avicola]|uniref:AEC family transporter n=1 Tax=Candidatus Avoscillospira avicola TaxID=2840706 RepID=A0A9D1DJ41_9FIRM|nr:AEC family transporter [Candidatus Avoscillospira avicola]
MWANFSYAFQAIAPILLLIALGMLVRRVGPWEGGFYRKLNALSFHLFLPVQLFLNVYAVADLADFNWAVMGYLIGSVFFCCGVGMLAARLFVRDPAQKGPIVQVAFRSNHAVLGLPLASALGGTAAMAFASLSAGLITTVFNFLAVVTLTWYSDQSHTISGWALVKRVFRNPLIAGAMSGLVLVILRQLLARVTGETIFFLRDSLPPVYQVLTQLSSVASPVMLFALGANLDLRAAKALLPMLRLGVLLRLVICPALVIGAAVALREPLGLTSLEAPSMVAVCASPAAVSSGVMVQEIGGDAQLANQLVVWTSVLSMATIFLLVSALRAMGLL